MPPDRTKPDVSATEPHPRVRRLRALLDERDCSHAVIAGTDHVVHLSGYSRYLGAPAAVVVGPDAKRTLVVARFELAAAEAEAEVDSIVPYGADDFLDFVPLRSLAEACQELSGASTVALAGGADFWSAFGADGRHAVDVESQLLALRRVKDEDELDRIRAAFRLALVGQSAVEALSGEGRTEIELFTAAFCAAQEAAGQPIEFVGALASGINTSLITPPVHVPAAARVAVGAPVLSDIAIRHRGYWGDSTRTFAADGSAAATRDVLSTILDETASSLRPGRRVADVHAEMHDAITSRLPGARFPHHGGHGIGIGVGEDPQIIPGEDSVVEAGMVFAIEPGAYWRGSHGARVENTYVVRSSGAELVAE